MRGGRGERRSGIRGEREIWMFPHQKLLGDGFLTPVPLFCLICDIISNKTGIFD